MICIVATLLATVGFVRAGRRNENPPAKSLGPHVALNLGEQEVEQRGTVVAAAPAETRGLVRRIEDPSGAALDPFYEALLAAALREPGAVARVAHWGDSTIASDDITSTLRRRLQRRFGDAGHGFVLVAKGHLPYHHRNIRHRGRGWKLFQLIQGRRRDGRYGPGGVLFTSWGGARAFFGTAKSGAINREAGSFEIFYQAHPRGGRMRIDLDGEKLEVLSTRHDRVEDRWREIDVDEGPHLLRVEALGGGQLRLYGVAMENAGPGVVYDSLGIVGARAWRMLNYDADHFERQVEHRDPDLLVLEFGGNESEDTNLTRGWYERKLTEVVRMVRAGKPEAACLLLSPVDQGRRGPDGEIVTVPVLHRIVEAQRNVAAAEGCGFYDVFSAMGGGGAIGRWHQVEPRLAWGDHSHATPEGFEVIGNMIYKALLAGFDDYLSREGLPAPGPPAPLEESPYSGGT